MGDVVVTGLAASTCFGLGVATLRERIEAPTWTADAPKTLRPVEVDIDALLRATRTRHEPTVQLLGAVEAGFGAAIRDAPASVRASMAVALANTSTTVGPYVEMYEAGSTDGPRAVNPAAFPTTMLNYPATQLARAFGITGPNTTVGSGERAGAEALAYAATRIASGRDRVCIAGGLEELPPRGSEALESPPYTEGIGLLLLADRTWDASPVLARLAGWATGASDPEQQLDRALERAGLARADVGAVYGTAVTLPGAQSVDTSAAFGRCLAADAPLACVAAVDAVSRGAYDATVVVAAAPRGAAAFVFRQP